MASVSKRRIAKNIFFLASSQGVTFLMTTAYAIVVPNYLNAEGVGILGIALSISSILAIVCTLGNGTFILREVARDQEKAKTLIGTAVINNLAVGLLAWAVVILVLNFLNVSQELRQICVIYAWANLITLAGLPISFALRGLEKMQYSFVEAVISKGLFTGLGILFALLNMGIIWVALATLIAAIPATIVNYWVFLREIRTSFVPKVENVKAVMRGGMAFFVIEVTFQVYLYLDALMLAFLTNNETVGYYRLPNDLFGTLLFVPVIVSSAILPALSRLAKEDPDNQIVMTRNALSFFTCISFPMAAGATIISAPLFHLVYQNKFDPSIPVFNILAWTTVPTYLGIGIYQSLVAQDRQGIWSKVNLIAAIVNALVNFGAIWYFHTYLQNGAIGAAVTLFVSEIVTTTIGMFLLAKGTINKQFWLTALKSLTATGIMSLAIFPIREVFFIVPTIVGLIVYGGAILALGVVPRSYIKLVLSLPARLRQKVV
jgi:O-antigen/teichoic acid export membrane protein